MSTALAIASVTAVLKNLLDNGLIDAGTPEPVTVTAFPPDRIETGAAEKSQLNIFLYRIVPNTGWRNAGMPSRDGTGQPVSNPPLALDLFYLLTAYEKDDLDAEVLLGYGMQVLHENPVFSRDAIREVLGANGPGSGGTLPSRLTSLKASNLADQAEQIKIAPYTLDTEEMSKLWTAFQAKYRPSVAYHVSVVLIEGTRSVRTALPVKGRRVRVIPVGIPHIDAIEPQAIEAGGAIDIVGRSLLGERVSVNFGPVVVTPAPEHTAFGRIRVGLPSELRCGVNTVQVRHEVDMSPDAPPPTMRSSLASNVGAFILRPTLSVKVEGAVQIEENGVVLKTGGIRCAVTPRIGKRQRVMLLLNELNPKPGTMARAFSLAAPHANGIADSGEATGSILFSYRIPKDAEGTYLVRISADEAENDLAVAADGRYSGPVVEL